jgi:hypothetical protein
MLTVQSVILSKDKYDLSEAENKVRKMGFNPLYRNRKANEYKAGETINWWRMRQISPLKFDKDSFKIKTLNKNIKLVVGRLKE